MIIERLKGEHSFYKPFLDYLPARNDTLFTLPDSTPIGGHVPPTTTLLSELQNPDDDLLSWIAYDRDINEKADRRFKEYIEASFA